MGYLGNCRECGRTPQVFSIEGKRWGVCVADRLIERLTGGGAETTAEEDSEAWSELADYTETEFMIGIPTVTKQAPI